MLIEWSLPLGSAFVMGMSAIACVITFWFHYGQGWPLHILAIGLMGIILLGPQDNVQPFSQWDTTHCHGLIDVSQSMAQTDGKVLTRLQQLQQEVINEETAYGNGLNLRWDWSTFGKQQAFSTLESLASLKSSDDQTNLLQALSQLDRQFPKDQPIILFSDGNSTETNASLPIIEQLKSNHRIVHAYAVGKPALQPVIKIDTWAEPSVIQKGTPTTLHVQLYGLSSFDQKPVFTANVYDGQVLIGTQTQQIDVLDAMTLTFPLTGLDIGLHVYRIELKDADSKVIARSTASVNVLDQPVNVLLLESQPHWVTRNVARAIQLDSQMHVTARYGLGDVRQLEIGQSQQQAASDQIIFDQWDVILLGKGTEDQLNEQARKQLAQWVKQGGGLLWLRGLPENSTHWPESLLPDSDMPTDEVQRMLTNLNLPDDIKKHLNIRTTNATSQGSVWQIDLDALNLPAIQATAMDQLVLRLIQSLSKPLAVESGAWASMTLDRHAARVNDHVQLDLLVLDNRQPKLQITEPDGNIKLLALTSDTTNPLRFFAEFTLNQEGAYHFNLTSHVLPAQAMHVRQAASEAHHLAANHGLLKMITEQTGGHFWQDRKQMVDDLEHDHQSRLATQTTRVWEDCFNHPMLVLLVISLWLGGWYLNRRRGGV